MDIQTTGSKIKKAVMVLICTLAISLSVFSIYSIYQLRQMAAMIYKHAHAVSSKAQGMRARFWDMRGFCRIWPQTRQLA